MGTIRMIVVFSCAFIFGACSDPQPVDPPSQKFVDRCPVKSTDTEVVPRLSSVQTTDERKKVFSVVFNNDCSYEFLASSVTLRSYRDFNDFYWDFDPFLPFPKSGKVAESIEGMVNCKKSNVYILRATGPANDYSESRLVIFLGKSILINENETWE